MNLRYDIDWHIAYTGEIPHELIAEINNRLAIDESNLVVIEGEDYTFKVHRSLDIIMPIVLTKGIDCKIECFRDTVINRFVIRVSK